MITPSNNGRSHFYSAAVLLAILPLLLWLCVGVPELVETEWQQRNFDKAFDYASQVRRGWSAAEISPVFVAAEACQTPAARAFVEQKCVGALLDNRGEGVESIVAYHILWESQQSLSQPAMEALQQLADNPATGALAASDLNALLQHLTAETENTPASNQ